MNCEILNTLYIRSNGDIPCNDDAGEKLRLGSVEPGDPPWNAEQALTNDVYTGIRKAFRDGNVPWLDTCPGCAFFRPNEPFVDALSEKRIRKVQIEPSLACNLRCPCCSNHLQIKTRPRPFQMPLALFEKALAGLRQANFDIGEIEYAGQGEPLLHREFPRFVDLAREYFPTTTQRVITNGNFDYWKATGGRWINEVFVSCDGVHQHSYEQYRIGGSVDKALKFMRDVPKEIDGNKQSLVWKYILFEFNDSDQEIYEAQRLANELGVETLLFVFTHSDFKSQRYTPENAADFPARFPNVTTNATPMHYRDSNAADSSMCELDDVRVHEGRWLGLRGWALSHKQLTGIRISVAGRVAGYARLGLERPDIFATHLGFGNPFCGFDFTGSVPQHLTGQQEIVVTLLSVRGPVKSFHVWRDFS